MATYSLIHARWTAKWTWTYYSVETEDTITEYEDKTLSDLPLFQDASTQASLPKPMKVSFSHSAKKGKDKGNDEGNEGLYIKCLFISFFDTATEIEKPPEHAIVAIQCDFLTTLWLQKLVLSKSDPSLDDSFLQKLS